MRIAKRMVTHLEDTIDSWPEVEFSESFKRSQPDVEHREKQRKNTFERVWEAPPIAHTQQLIDFV